MTDVSDAISSPDLIALRRWALEQVLLHLHLHSAWDAVVHAEEILRFVTGSDALAHCGGEAASEQVEDGVLDQRAAKGAFVDLPFGSKDIHGEGVSHGGDTVAGNGVLGHDRSLIGGVATPMMAVGGAGGHPNYPHG